MGIDHILYTYIFHIFFFFFCLHHSIHCIFLILLLLLYVAISTFMYVATLLKLLC